MLRKLSQNEEIDFKGELAKAINKYCIENGSNTPDFVIADYLFECIRNLETAINDRAAWFGRYDKINESDPDPGEMDGDHESALASAGFGTDEDYGGGDERI